MTIIVGADIGKTGFGDSAQRCLTDNGGCDVAVSGTIVFRAGRHGCNRWPLRLETQEWRSGQWTLQGNMVSRTPYVLVVGAAV
jgi:hypothetical protein